MIAQQALETNKMNILAALRAAGINEVVVAYSGGGDSGQMDGITVSDPNGGLEIPPTPIRFIEVYWDYDVSAKRSVCSCEERLMNLAEAIESLCWSLLSSTHGGWENNSGGDGAFTISVPRGEFSLRHVEYFEDHEVTSHTF